jgi:TonB family protein
MRRLLMALAFFTTCALAQDQAATSADHTQANYARLAFDTARGILQSRPYDFQALYTTISQVTEITPTPADLDAAQTAALRLISAGKPLEMSDAEWAKTREQTSALVDKVLIAIDRLRNSGTKPVIAQIDAAPAAEVQSQNGQAQYVQAEYSDEARLAGLEGSVLVTGTIADDGSMQDLHVSRPLGLGLDEQAIAAVGQWRFARGSPQPETFEIGFALPSKPSRWHLVGVEFDAPEGASRPTFAAADYPPGPGVGPAAYDEARILAAIGRGASATLSFDVDERGYPEHFLVVNASLDLWGAEAAMMVQNWRFHAGLKAGMPVSVPCTLSLVWGPEDFTSRAISGQVGLRYPPAPAPPPGIEPVEDAVLISRPEPEYTDEARRAGVQGTVWISLTVDQEGIPAPLSVASGPLGMGLEESAVKAIRQWRFQPMRLNGQPSVVSLAVRVDFRPSGVESFITRQGPPKLKR